MGLSLTLLPYDCDEGDFCFSHTVLSCCSYSGLFDEIRAIEDRFGRNVSTNFTTFVSREGGKDSHYGVTIETPYREPVVEVQNKHLRSLASDPGVEESYINKAIWAYLKCLPEENKVALFWH